MVVNFSYNESKSTINEFKLAKGEKFIQTVSLNNQFYLITGDKNKRELYFNTFNDSGEISKHKVDFSGCPIFINKLGMVTKVIDLLMRAKRIDRFEYNTPNSVEEVSDPSKIYVKDDNVIFTFDDNEKFTQVLVVNMNTFKASKKEFIKPLSQIKDTRKKTNSFISGKYVFLVSSTKQLFSMRIVGYENGEKLKEFEVKQHENISFKNSPIIHEGSVYNSYRELKKTKQFLRKITSGQIGVSVLNQNDNFIVTIGGCPYCSTNPPTNGYVSVSPTTGAMTMSSVSTPSISNNTTSMAYNSFLHTNSTRIFCKFDKNFNHIKGEIKDNAFDKIKRDKKEYNIKEENETIFKYRDYYVQIHYEDSLKKYVLKKYTND